MFSLSWHRTSSKPNVNFRLFLFCLTGPPTLFAFCLHFIIITFTLNDELVIMGGDFNLVMDCLKDKKRGNVTTHGNSLKEVQNIANSLDLIDVWRTLNPDGKRFTWRIRKMSSTRMTKFCKRQNPSIKTYTLLLRIRLT